jgi:hypothetical protein
VNEKMIEAQARPSTSTGHCASATMTIDAGGGKQLLTQNHRILTSNSTYISG